MNADTSPAHIVNWSWIVVALLVAACAVPAQAAPDEDWPEIPRLALAVDGVGMGPLPPSINASPVDQGEWMCVFRFQPDSRPNTIVLTGSFNGWDRQAVPMKGPDENGDWRASVELATGIHEYKFLVDDQEWVPDPRNVDRRPDGFGGYNSLLRLGRLAQMKTSDAEVGDGKIEGLGLEHRPPLPMYTQPLSDEAVMLRYRTMAHDVEGVEVMVRGREPIAMTAVTETPLFKYWQATVHVPPSEGRTRAVRSVEYAFVLQDGDTRAMDPQTYHYSFVPTQLFDTPDWATEAIWYQIMVDRFRNGDPSNDPEPTRPWTSAWYEPSPWEAAEEAGFYEYVFDRYYGGDIAGLQEKLPYLKELGVNAIYLMPVFKAPSNHKYDVQNYIHIDDHFGRTGDYAEVVAQEDLLDPSTWQWTESDRQFLAFLERAHELGFKVIIDGVFNHVGDQHPAFVDVSENGRSSRFADWFAVNSWEPFKYEGWADFQHMPVFNKDRDGFASRAVHRHIFAITKRWMDPDGDGDPSDGVDGWRLDVPTDIPRTFWAQWRRYVKSINPDALITGEIWYRADQYLDGQHFDAVMNYEFAKIAVRWIIDREQKITASDAASQLEVLRLAYPKEATYALQNLIDSHDTDRVASMAMNPDREYDRQNRVQDNNPDYISAKPTPEAYARARLVALLQMTYVGAPMIYYGDEAGMWGADDPSNRKPMVWADLPGDTDESRPMPAQLDFYREVTAVRHAHPALRTGSFETLLTDDAADVWAFLRSNPDEHVIVVLNASEEPRQVQIPVANGLPTTWQVAFGGNGTREAGGGSITVEVPAIGGVVLAGSGE